MIDTLCCIYFFNTSEWFCEGELLVSFPQTKTKMGEVMREAAFSLAEAKFTAGDFR